MEGVGNAVNCYCLGMDEKNKRKGHAVDYYCLGMDEMSERKVWAMKLTVIV